MISFAYFNAVSFILRFLIGAAKNAEKWTRIHCKPFFMTSKKCFYRKSTVVHYLLIILSLGFMAFPGRKHAWILGWVSSWKLFKASCQGVTKRCRPSWLTNSALLYEPKCGGWGLLGLSQWVQLCTWSPNKLWRSNSMFNLKPHAHRQWKTSPLTFSLLTLLVSPNRRHLFAKPDKNSWRWQKYGKIYENSLQTFLYHKKEGFF